MRWHLKELCHCKSITVEINKDADKWNTTLFETDKDELTRITRWRT